MNDDPYSLWTGQGRVPSPPPSKPMSGGLAFILVAGAVLLVGGIGAMLLVQSNLNVCQSFWGQLAQGASASTARQCNTYMAVHQLGIMAGALGAVGLLAGAIVVGSSGAAGPESVPPHLPSARKLPETGRRLSSDGQFATESPSGGVGV